MNGLVLAGNVRSQSGVRVDPRQSLGILGEDIACRELAGRGYEILARRYRTRAGEIDIIARDGPTIVFVEVKARAGNRFGGAAAAVTGWKQRRIALMAADYLARRQAEGCPCRFDVVAIDFVDGKMAVAVYPDAFVPG